MSKMINGTKSFWGTVGILLLIIDFAYCKAAAKKIITNSIQTESIVINSTNKDCNLYYIDKLGIGHPRFVGIKDTLKLNNNEAVTMIIANDIQSYAICSKNDTLDLITQGPEKRTFIISAKNKKLSIVLNEVMLRTGTLRPSRIYSRNENKKTSSFDILNKRILYSDSLFNNKTIDENLKNYLDFTFNSAYEGTVLPKNNYDFYKLDFKHRMGDKDMLYDSIMPMPYLDCLLASQRFLVKDSLSDEEWFNTINTKFHGFEKEILITRGAILRLNAKNINEMISLVDTTINNQEFKNQFNSIVKIKKDLFATKMLPDNSLMSMKKDTINFSKIIRSKNSKLSYVDTWASWCSPCRQEFKYYTQDFLSKFPSSVNIIFISLDENLKLWKEAAQNYSIMNTNNSFCALGGIENKIAKTYKILQIPRYMIFDNNGNIVVEDAPRPSDAHLMPLLTKLLSNKL